MTRKERFLAICEATGQEFDQDEVAKYGGERFVVLYGDGSLGEFNTADTMDEVAGCIGDLIDSPWGFGGWYDLDDESIARHGANWAVSICVGDEFGTADARVGPED